MKYTHRLTAIAVAALLATALAGCDNKKEQSKTFNRAVEGVELSFTYYYDGDKVLRQDANNTIPYKTIGASNKEQARAIIEPMSSVYRSIKGVEQTIDYKDSYALEHLSVDFSEAKISELCKLPGSMFTDCSRQFVSMSVSTKLLEEQGFQEVK
jgi:uncharacterized lipoprotein YehR (DUF1307 family)